MTSTQELSQLLEEALPHIAITREGNNPTSHTISQYRGYLQTIRSRREPSLEFYAYTCRITIGDAELESELRTFVTSALSEYIHEGKVQTATIGIYGAGIPGGVRIESLITKLLELAVLYGARYAAQVFVEALSSDHCEYKTYTLLRGIGCQSSIPLYDGVEIIALPTNSGHLPDYLPSSFSPSDAGDQFLGATLIAEEWSARPRFMNLQQYWSARKVSLLDDTSPFTLEIRSSSSPAFNRDEFCKALSLTIKATVFPSVIWKYISKDEIINCSGGPGGAIYADDSIFQPRHNITTEQLVEAKNLYETLMALQPEVRTRIAIPIDRLIASWRGKDRVDQIIDLAISLESLYLPDGAAELAHRLRIRGARHLETDFERRQLLANHLKKFYRVRSRAVHTGIVPDEHNVNGQRMTTDELIDTTQEICLRSILKVISDGFPNWEHLELG